MTITVVLIRPSHEREILGFTSKEELDERFPFLAEYLTEYTYDYDMEVFMRSVHDNRYSYRIIIKH